MGLGFKILKKIRPPFNPNCVCEIAGVMLKKRKMKYKKKFFFMKVILI